MDRSEAVLRELNLSPLWQRRNKPVAAEHPVQGKLRSDSADTTADETIAKPSLMKTPAILPGGQQMVDQRLVVSETEVPGASLASSLNWNELKEQVHECTACKLRAGCTQTVFGVGDERAEWLFVGEGPGEDEDARGEPFVGQAGRLLDNMLMAISLKRGRNVYIANIVKCRPPNNRTPYADEIAACLPYLRRQIELIKPRLIVALGKTAATALLGSEAPLGSLRGTLRDYCGIPLLVTYHPSYLLRCPMEKAKAWQDLRIAMNTMQKLP